MILAQSQLSAKMGGESGWWQQQRLSIKVDKESLDYPQHSTRKDWEGCRAAGGMGLESHSSRERNEAENNRNDREREGTEADLKSNVQKRRSLLHFPVKLSSLQRCETAGRGSLASPQTSSSTQISNMSANRQLSHQNTFFLNAATFQKQRHVHIFLHGVPGGCSKRHYRSLQKLKWKSQQEAAP